MKYIFALCIAALTTGACTQVTPVDQPDSTNSTLNSTEAEKKIKDPTYLLQDVVRKNRYQKKDLKIRINKSAYTLKVFHKDSLLITYPCVFGFNAVDDKHREGDGCTPEGTFKIRSMYAHHSWSYFIWIDYPNKESWRRFKERRAQGIIDNEATIGGEIGIHGVPGDADDLINNKTNWTLGCISLKKAHITDLYKSINATTLIEIVK